MTLARGRKALVTGGASGFGLAIARMLHTAGAGLALLDVDRETLEQPAAELPAATSLHADVRSREQVGSAVDGAKVALGGLDTLVVSAGVIHIRDWKVRHTGAAPEQITAAAAGANPLGRNATEGDVVAAALFFVSDEAAFVTGTALDVDGGAHLAFALPGTS